VDKISSPPLRERKWVQSLVPRLSRSLQHYRSAGIEVGVRSGTRLPYTCEIHEYAENNSSSPVTSPYETDLLVFDTFKDGRWIPRVVVECKLGSITTHDALTYSSKAATHKHVHPYLRYGFLAGAREHYAIPGRLVKHGAYFDFMVAWTSAEPSNRE
jgi:hypothetical protein